MSYTLVQQSVTRLADDLEVRIHGVERDVHIKLGTVRAKRSFLVADMPSIDIVLGMDFCHDHNVVALVRRRYIDIESMSNKRGAQSRVVRLKARREASEPFVKSSSTSDTFELCTADAFAKLVNRASDDELDDAFVACVMHEMNAVDHAHLSELVLSGNGAMHPKIAVVLHENRDVLVSQIPGGLPLERFDKHGDPIEHTIEVPRDATAFKRNPRPSMAEEDAGIQRYISVFFK